MVGSRIIYTCRPNTRAEAELNALEAIYRRAIERYDEGKEGGPATAQKDDVKEPNGYVATENHSR